MGFLLGAFGKLNAGKYYRSLQRKMMNIQSKARRVSRQVERMEKQIDRAEKTALNNLTMQSNSQYALASSQLNGNLAVSLGEELFNKIFPDGQNGAPQLGELTSDESSKYNSVMSALQSSLANMKSTNETNIAYQKQQIEDYFEMMRENQLEPLKDEEELLQTEKESLESQIQLAKADYDACKQMEQQDAKLIAPNYTGGGQ